MPDVGLARRRERSSHGRPRGRDGRNRRQESDERERREQFSQQNRRSQQHIMHEHLGRRHFYHKAAKELAWRGKVQRKLVQGGMGILDGKAFLLGEGNKFRAAMPFTYADYWGEQLLFDGSTI